MSLVPTKTEAFLTFCETYGPNWNTNALALGLTVERVQAFMVLAGEARANWIAKNDAAATAKVATVASQEKIAETRSSLSDIIRDIRAFADQSADPSAVYQLAKIPAPAAPTPAPPPAQPTGLTVSIDPASGELTLRWKATNPAPGTGYIIRRRAAGESAFSIVGIAGNKTFSDSTFTAGPDKVEYTVQGTRSGIVGPLSPIFTVNFGKAPGDGALFATVTEQPHAKMAA